MPPDALFTLVLVLLMLITLAVTRIGPDLIFFAGLTVLLVSGILTPAEALSGFSNPGVLTVGVLFVVVAGLRDTGGIRWIAQHLLGRPKSVAAAQLRLMMPVTFLSAFLNNTPVVAMMVPAVTEWAKKLNFAPSKLMIPLSYASIFGGMCTLIGTSTNLVVNGLLVEANNGIGFTMFELAWIGVPAALVGILYLMTLGRWLLPARGSLREPFKNPREYTLEMIVDPAGPLVGRSVEEAGLRQLTDMYLAEIDRQGRLVAAVSPDERLQGNDRLIFVGVIDAAVDLHRTRGLLPATQQVFKLDGARAQRGLIEAVVSVSNPLLGRSVRDGRFRNHYSAVVLAVARHGERIRGKVGDIVLRAGDTLLLEARPAFVHQQRNSRDFYLVSTVQDSAPLNHERALVAFAILGAMVGVVALGLLSMLEAAMLAAGLMLLGRCTSGANARRSIDWQLLSVIGAALGVGGALEKTGAAAWLAQALTSLAGSNLWLNLLLVYLVTSLFTEIITNNAAAVLVFPIALATAETLGVSIMPFVVAVTVAASASFATPIGYQTNLMVYGPGGYRFTDYVRLGVPLSLMLALLASVLIPLVWRY